MIIYYNKKSTNMRILGETGLIWALVASDLQVKF